MDRQRKKGGGLVHMALSNLTIAAVHAAVASQAFKVRPSSSLLLLALSMLSKQQRIESVAPKLRILVQQHEDGTYHGGVEAFNALIMGVIKQADRGN